jgi:hypothetical protein
VNKKQRDRRNALEDHRKEIRRMRLRITRALLELVKGETVDSARQLTMALDSRLKDWEI